MAAARANLEAVGLADRDATFVRARLPAWRPSARFDLVFCDPPTASSTSRRSSCGLDAGVVVLETDRDVAAPEGWETSSERRYGGTLVTMLKPTTSGVGE